MGGAVPRSGVIAVMDAGVIASGLVHATDAENSTARVMRALVTRRFVHVTSDSILDEANRALGNRRYFRIRFADERRAAALAAVRELSVVVPLPVDIPAAAPHRHDDPVLATVAASGADWFVTGDAALQAMGSFAEAPFLDPAGFLAALDEAAG